MAAEVEARLKISAVDRTAKAFDAIEQRLKKAERLSRIASQRERAEAKADALARKEIAVRQREEAVARARGPGGLVAAGGGYLAAGVAGAVSVGAVANAVTSYAALERQMTRIGLAAGATRDETSVATSEIGRMAVDLAMPLDQAVGGFEALVATGKTMKEALAFLPSILRTAQASGAATEEMAASANSLATSLKVPVSQMQEAFDALVVGGQLGQFELKDMARYLPSLTASAAKLGFSGQDGVNRLVAMLQTVRQVSGTAEEAATAVRDSFEKVLSPTVANAFKKKGVDIGKVLVEAGRKGENQFEAVLNVIDKMTKGMDETQRNLFLSSIFTESESRRAIVSMIQLREQYGKYLDALKSSKGATEENLNRVLQDTQASVDRLATGFDRMVNALGRAADAFGVTTLMNGVANVANGLSDRLDEAYRVEAALDKAFGGNQQEKQKWRVWASEADIMDMARKGGYMAPEEREAQRKRDAEAAAVSQIPGGAPMPRADPRGVTLAERQNGWQEPPPGPPAPPPAPRTQMEYYRQKWNEWFGGPAAPAAQPPDLGSIADTNARIRALHGTPDELPAPPLPPPMEVPTGFTGLSPSTFDPRQMASTLETALSGGSGEIARAGTDIAAALRDAADNLRRAGEDAARAISSAQISPPSFGAVPRGANANVGRSMPSAGTPGGW